MGLCVNITGGALRGKFTKTAGNMDFPGGCAACTAQGFFRQGQTKFSGGAVCLYILEYAVPIQLAG